MGNFPYSRIDFCLMTGSENTWFLALGLHLGLRLGLQKNAISKRNVAVRVTFRVTNLGFLERLRGDIWLFFGIKVQYKTFLTDLYDSKKTWKNKAKCLYKRHLTQKETQKSVCVVIIWLFVAYRGCPRNGHYPIVLNLILALTSARAFIDENGISFGEWYGLWLTRHTNWFFSASLFSGFCIYLIVI